MSPAGVVQTVHVGVVPSYPVLVGHAGFTISDPV